MKLFTPNFIKFIIALESHLIAKTLIRFAIPLFVLLETGNPTLMGTVLSISALPLIILTPIGGTLSDRFNKKRLLQITNATSAIFIIIHILINPNGDNITLIILIMALIAIVESFITPTNEASLPLIVGKENLVKANSITFLCTNFSSIGAPLLGGFLLYRFNLFTILVVIGFFYLLSSFLYLTIKIPKTNTVNKTSNIVKGLLSDIITGIKFVTTEKKSVGKIIFIVFLLAITLITSMTIAVPTLMVTYFKFPEHLIGISQGIVVAGGTLAAIILPKFGDKIGVHKSQCIIFIPAVTVVATDLILLVNDTNHLNFVIVVACFFICQIFLTMYGVLYFSFLGTKTPSEAMGKVMGLAISTSVLGFAIGDFIHGLLFSKFIEVPGIVLIIIGLLAVGVGLFEKVEE